MKSNFYLLQSSDFFQNFKWLFFNSYVYILFEKCLENKTLGKKYIMMIMTI